jgi:hypothetical protein
MAGSLGGNRPVRLPSKRTAWTGGSSAESGVFLTGEDDQLIVGTTTTLALEDHTFIKLESAS